MNYQERIERHPNLAGGEAVIKGTRVTLRTVLASLAEGASIDEILPGRLVALLTALGHDVDTVPSEGIAGKDDDHVWRAAQADRRFLITQDLDFSDVRKYAPGTHHGLWLVRLPKRVAPHCSSGLPRCSD